MLFKLALLSLFTIGSALAQSTADFPSICQELVTHAENRLIIDPLKTSRYLNIQVEADLVSVHHVYRPAQPGFPTFVLMPQIDGSTRTYNKVFEGLPAEFGILAVDLRGQGGTQALDSAERKKEVITVSENSTIVADLVHHYGLKDIILVGHSYSTFVALNYSLKFASTQLNSLEIVLIAPPLRLIGNPEKLREKWYSHFRAGRLNRNSVDAWTEARVESLAKLNRGMQGLALTTLLQQRATAPGLKIPVYILHPTKENLVPAEDVQSISTQMKTTFAPLAPAGVLSEVSVAGGHLLVDSNPLEVATQLTQMAHDHWRSSSPR